MAEHGARYDGVLMLQTADELVGVALGVEAQPVHAGVELDVDGPPGDALLLGSLDEGVHQSKRVDLGFQVVVEHGLEGSHLGVHDHDVLRDSMAAQDDTLVGHGHGEIVHAVGLQRLGHLDGSGSVGIGLDHADELGLGLHVRAVVVQVADQRVEVDLEDSLVHLLLQELGDAVETEGAGALDEHHLVVQLAQGVAAQEIVGGGKERRTLDGERRTLGRDAGAYSDEGVDAALLAQRVHLAVQLLVGHAALEDVAQYERAADSLAAAHEVEGDVERVDVRVVRVVDERAAVLAFLHLQSHGHGLQMGHALGQLVGGDAQIERHGGAGKRALQRGFVEEGDFAATPRTFIEVGDLGDG